MSTRSALELKIRITLLLLLWAAICLTAYTDSSTIFSDIKFSAQKSERDLPAYVMNWDKLND
ncbi:MAG: hypothetical protein ACLFUB_13990 [Cyclobacteriaceae bacterium]